jgi:hypothetical protein
MKFSILAVALAGTSLVDASRLVRRGCTSSKTNRPNQVIFYGKLGGLSDIERHDVEDLKLCGTPDGLPPIALSDPRLQTYIDNYLAGTPETAQDFAKAFGLVSFIY